MYIEVGMNHFVWYSVIKSFGVNDIEASGMFFL